MSGDWIDTAQQPGLAVPRNLSQHAGRRLRTEWVSALPAVVDRLREELALDFVGEPFQPGGQTAWVAPVHSPVFGDVVLKIGFRHYEAFDEANGLREWNGDRAVRIFAGYEVDDHTTALLLERLRPGTLLSTEEDEIRDAVIAELLPRLWREPPFARTFRPLTEMCDAWADSCQDWAQRQGQGLDPGMVREGIALFRSLPREQTRQVLLCTDLHADNVLAAERERWLMIDPKPFVGDPTYDALQHILNCQDRLAVDPRALITRIADLLCLDAERLASWLFARCVVGAPDWPELMAIARRLAPD